jgi:RNA polymerase sigma-70 factor, ECF subfamily
MGGMFS